MSTQEDIVKLETKIDEVKTDVIKWMFVFWTSYTVIILRGIYAFLKVFLDK